MAGRPARRVAAPAEDCVEPGHGLGVHGRQGVAVRVEGDRHPLVTEHLGHDLGLVPAASCRVVKGVAQVMEADRRQAGVAQQRLQLAGRDVRSTVAGRRRRRTRGFGASAPLLAYLRAAGESDTGGSLLGSGFYSEISEPSSGMSP